MAHVKVKHLGKMLFAGIDGENKVFMDAFEEFGGMNMGVAPKNLMLVALGGCSGMDVVSLLRKMKVEFSDFEIEVVASTTDTHPKVFDSVTVIYKIKSKKEFEDKIKKAITLSQEKYCSVVATMKHTGTIKWELQLQEEE